MNKKEAYEHSLLLFFFFIIGIYVGTLIIPVNKSDDKKAPSDFFKTNDVSLSPTQIIINNSRHAQLAMGTVMASGSMIPIFDHNAMTLNVVPQNPCEINVGDIIVYEDLKKTLIIHRVINVTNDYEFITQGDHNLVEDDPVKFSQIKYRIVGIIY